MTTSYIAGVTNRFVDPHPALQAEYRAAVERLRQEVGDPKTWMDRLGFWAKCQGLRWKHVVKPQITARW